jgi:hypothetical protein
LTGYANIGKYSCDEIPDHDAWNALQSARKLAWTSQQVLADLQAVRLRLLGELDRLSSTQWTTPVLLPWGEIAPLTAMVSGLAWHENEHTGPIIKWKASWK